jgi:hypothetical protein
VDVGVLDDGGRVDGVLDDGVEGGVVVDGVDGAAGVEPLEPVGEGFGSLRCGLA